jgi:sugar lactone lactonase YvrE
MSRNPTRLLIFISLLALSACICFATPSTINTVAGGGPNGIPALHSNLLWPSNAVVNSSGQVYFTAWHRVYRLTPAGDLEAIAGVGGDRGYSGDGLPALNADLYYPSGLAFDAAGNLFIADTLNGRVRKVDAVTGIISTVAGGGANNPGDGGPATAARLVEPIGIVFDGAGNLYISDWEGRRVRRVDAATQMITTYAGGGADSGDGVPATSIQLNQPSYLAIDGVGNLYISESSGNAVRKVDAVTHNITTVASLAFPTGLALDDGAGLLYIAAQGHVYRLNLATSGITQVSPSLFDFSFESGGGLALDGSGHLFIADTGNNLLQRLTLSGAAIAPVAGNGGAFQSEDGFPATKTYLDFPFSAAKDSLGNLYVAEDRMRRVDAATGLVGTATGIPIGGGAQQPLPRGSLLMDGADNLYIATDTNQILRRDALTGMLSLVAGTGTLGFSGDGGPATAAELGSPWLGSFDGGGNLFFVDVESQRIRRIDALTGIITTVAGNGSITFSGDGGPAVSAGLNPSDVAADGAGNLYIADYRNHRVRRVDALTGIITTYAGTGVRGNGPDNVLATQSPLDFPTAIAIDGGGNVHVADGRVRRIDAATQIITTVAGSGIGGFYGDGGPASAARFEDFSDLFFDASNSFYLTDAFAFRVREVSMDATGNPPVAVAQAGDASGCTPGGASVHLDGSSSSDPDSTAGTNDDIVLFEWFENFGAADAVLLGSGETLDVTLPSGNHVITLRVTDTSGLSDSDQVTVVVGDAVAPQIQVSVSPNVLSPANKKFVPVHATVTASDACGPVSVVLLKITAADGGITYDPAPASEVRDASLGTADFDVELRAARSKAGSGRIYTLVYQATDASGNSALGSATVLVPLHRHTPSQNQGKSRIPPMPRD